MSGDNLLSVAVGLVELGLLVGTVFVLSPLLVLGALSDRLEENAVRESYDYD